MALSQEQLMELARHGAQARLAQLRAEIAEIERAFPNVDGSNAATRARGRRGRGPTGARDGDVSLPRRRRRPTMSAAQKKAVSERMRKYWAARRAENTKSNTPAKSNKK